jgi:hypothetical protein
VQAVAVKILNTKRRDVQKAIKLYEEFRESPARRGRVIEIDIPKIVMNMGTVRFIGYDTTLKGKTDLRAHNFAPGSRPYLCVNPNTQELFIVGGRYHVTDRGIVDLDSHRREIDDGAEGEWKPALD